MQKRKIIIRNIPNPHIRGTATLISPHSLKTELPTTKISYETVMQGREAIRQILQQNDRRLLVIVGPCSIHDPKAAIEYASKLRLLQEEVKSHLYVLMRVYFEKPRTTVGWKGLISDPYLDGSCDMQHGLKIARRLLLEITAMGIPTATEVLDPIIPEYLADLVSWAAIGARTTESQTHREMASGLSMPVGFKNATDGSLQTAIDAMESARHPHNFVGIDQNGRTCIIKTTGNRWGHVVLRGGRTQTNYGPESIRLSIEQLKKASLRPAVMVDCSHANSGKQHQLQEAVWESVLYQRCEGNNALIGMMVESNLHAGNQAIPNNPRKLRYGISVTDKCINWETTERMIKLANEMMAKRSAVPGRLIKD